jgi:serine/threonine protein kinase
MARTLPRPRCRQSSPRIRAECFARTAAPRILKPRNSAASAAAGSIGCRSNQPPLPSSFAAGRYAVKGFLGEGARKRVYLAHDTRLNRDVAVAVIKTEGLDAAGLARVRNEAQAMARLCDHPNVVTIFDVGEEADGQPYMVSQYMAGGSLEEMIAVRRKPRAFAVSVSAGADDEPVECRFRER